MSQLQLSAGETLSTFMVQSGKTKLDEVIVNYAKAISKDCKISETVLKNIWTKVSNECAGDLITIIEKENKKRENEFKKVQKKLEDANMPPCIHEFGVKAKKAGQQCGEPSAKDGNGLCNKHKKKEKSEVDAKNACCFEYPKDTKNNKKGDICANKNTEEFIYELIKDWDYEDVKELEYQGQLICKKHTTQIIKTLKTLENPCTHEFGKKSERKGEICGKLAVDGTDKCKVHTPKDKKSKKKKSDADKRKKAKNNKKDSDNESDIDEKNKKIKDSKKSKQESDDEVEHIKETKKTTSSKKKKESKKIKAKKSFKLTKGKPQVPKWETTFLDGEGDETINVFIDTVSGLTCVNSEDLENDDVNQIFDDKTKKYNIMAIGIWNNETQCYDEFNENDDDAILYAQAMNIELVNEVEDE
jgi:hypothetical protein